METYLRSETLKEKINEELHTLKIQNPDVFSESNIDLLLKVLYLPLDNPQIRLEGLQTRVPQAMGKILLQSQSKSDRLMAFPEFAKVEPFLQKIVYLVDETEYSRISAQRAGLAKSIDFLGLNPNNLRLSTALIDDTINMTGFANHILRAYQLRNLESHQCLNWSNRELYENLESILVTYIYTIHLHSGVLLTKISPEPDFTLYLENSVREFEDWQNRFVHITGQERFEEVPIHAIESDEWGSGVRTVLRVGKIDDLRKNLEENTMVVLGDPGMGKSTTMQYILYNDAKEALNNGQHESYRIPLYLELKLLSRTDSIVTVAAQKLGISQDKLTEYFQKGRITLLLDGLNEVYAETRRSIRMEIQTLISVFTELFIIVTSRPLAYSNEFKNSPVFILQRLEDDQIQEFLEKNCRHAPTEEIIKNEINSNIRLGRIVRVPLLLKMLITVVKNNGGIMPQNKTQIIREFIDNIYERERLKDITDTDFRIIHRLLCFLAHKTRESSGSNVGWRIDELESILEKKIEKLKFKLNAYDFIDMSTDLNLLVKDGSKYSFIHELYQEYFAAEEILRNNNIRND